MDMKGIYRKNNPNYVREDQENLKVNDEDEIIKWSYTHGKLDSNITSPTLKRRAYWLYRTKSQIPSSQVSLLLVYLIKLYRIKIVASWFII